MFISVWAKEQELTKQFIKINDQNDYFVTWKNNINNKEEDLYKRYYHLFSLEEVKILFPTAQINFEKNNWNIIIIK